MIRIERDHKLSRQAAKDKVEGLVPELMRRYGDAVTGSEYRWRGDVLEFSGSVSFVSLKGTLEVTETRLILQLDGVPFFVTGRVRSEIERHVDEYLRD